MYGLLLEAIEDYIRITYGDSAWEEIRHRAGVGQYTFSTHTVYSETLIPRLASATSEITGTPYEEVMDGLGSRFVAYVGQFGYDRILKVLGRHMRDFLNGLDNLHEYLRFSYPKLKPPSFFCENESRSGLTLHYRSKRKGFVHYVKGQIRQVGKMFYSTKVDIDVLTETTTGNITHVTMRLHFENTAFRETESSPNNVVHSLPVKSDVFFEVFPFNIVFNRNMVIRNVGAGLAAVMKEVEGQGIAKVFSLVRPLLDFTWDSLLMHTNNVFELTTKHPIRKVDITEKWASPDKEKGCIDEKKDFEDMADQNKDEESERPCLRLKGQMMFMEEWESMVFLGTPIMENVDAMFNTGLYINDLSMHDSSRDLVLAGTQQSAELKLALDQEQQKSRKLEESMEKLDSEMKRTDSLLYQMIPKTVADRLRKGEPAMKTCEVFESVTILFSDVVGFTTICSQITPLAVVSMLNAMYTKFDQISERHNVYKVETIGDAYMVVSGAPTVTKYHALHISNMALDMLDSMADLKDPSSSDNMRIRVGVHTGTAVAGVVGLKMPRYCLFGDSVNTASRMETNGEAMKIHISETTKHDLEEYPYIYKERGSIQIKGKGSMKTYWLLGRKSEEMPKCPFTAIIEEEIQKAQSLKADVNLTSPSGETRSLYSPVTFDEVTKSLQNTNNNTPDGTPAKTTLMSWHEGQRSMPLTSVELMGIPMVAAVAQEPDANDYNNSPTRTAAHGKVFAETRLDEAGERIHNVLSTQSASKRNSESEKPRSQTCNIL